MQRINRNHRPGEGIRIESKDLSVDLIMMYPAHDPFGSSAFFKIAQRGKGLEYVTISSHKDPMPVVDGITIQVHHLSSEGRMFNKESVDISYFMPRNYRVLDLNEVS